MICLLFTLVFFYYAPLYHLDLHSFPTRRSSDLLSPRRPRYRVFRAGPSAFVRGRRPAAGDPVAVVVTERSGRDRKSTRLNSSHGYISYAVFCLKKKKQSDWSSAYVVMTVQQSAC